MALNLQAGGFVPCRKLNGGTASLKTLRVSAATNEAYFIGATVILGTSGRVRPLKAASTTPPLGVITCLQKVSNGKPMPLTFNLPTNGAFLTSGQEGFATVNISPDQTYVVQFDGNVTEANFGAAYQVTAGAPTTSTGLSGVKLQTTALTTVGADAQFQMLGLAPIEMLTTRTSVAGQSLVEVIMVRSVFGYGGGGPGGAAPGLI